MFKSLPFEDMGGLEGRLAVAVLLADTFKGSYDASYRNNKRCLTNVDIACESTIIQVVRRDPVCDVFFDNGTT